MELVLRCNNLIDGYCRKELRNEAFVTTCSHVFCRDCVHKHHLHSPAGGRRQCPACTTKLPLATDVVQSNLQPSEEYQSTILCGLDPVIINECAGRALKFWKYQMSTEIAWQQHLTKQWTDKHAALYKNAHKVIDAANTEIGELAKQVETLSKEKEDTERRMSDLADQYQNKTTEYGKVAYLYAALKDKVLNDTQRPAMNAEQTVRSMDRTLGAERSIHHVSHRPNVSELPAVYKTPYHSKFSTDRRNVEQLHPFQRSGSARNPSSDAAAIQAMPPPIQASTRQAYGRANTTRTPAQRATAPHTVGNHTYPASSRRPVEAQRSTAFDMFSKHPSDQLKTRYDSRQHTTGVALSPNVQARRPLDREFY